METEIKVTVIKHEELVDILSTALHDSSWFTACYNRSLYETIENKQGECFEDKLADMLLAGHKIIIVDGEADGESYSDRFVEFIDYGNAVYEIGLQDFLNAASTERGYQLFEDMRLGYGDYYTADSFLQRVVFGEVVYG